MIAQFPSSTLSTLNVAALMTSKLYDNTNVAISMSDTRFKTRVSFLFWIIHICIRFESRKICGEEFSFDLVLSSWSNVSCSIWNVIHFVGNAKNQIKHLGGKQCSWCVHFKRGIFCQLGGKFYISRSCVHHYCRKLSHAFNIVNLRLSTQVIMCTNFISKS